MTAEQVVAPAVRGSAAGAAAPASSSELVQLAGEIFARVARNHVAGVLADARIEGLSQSEAVARLVILASIDVRRVDIHEDNQEGDIDDHHW